MLEHCSKPASKQASKQTLTGARCASPCFRSAATGRGAGRRGPAAVAKRRTCVWSGVRWGGWAVSQKHGHGQAVVLASQIQPCSCKGQSALQRLLFWRYKGQGLPQQAHLVLINAWALAAAVASLPAAITSNGTSRSCIAVWHLSVPQHRLAAAVTATAHKQQARNTGRLSVQGSPFPPS